LTSRFFAVFIVFGGGCESLLIAGMNGVELEFGFPFVYIIGARKEVLRGDIFDSSSHEPRPGVSGGATGVPGGLVVVVTKPDTCD
jgi:hypothetical protein